MSGASLRPLAEIVAETLGKHGHIHHKRHAIRLGQIVMPTKAAAKDLLKGMLHKSGAEPGIPLPLDYAVVLLAAIRLHPHAVEKLQHGCAGFLIRANWPLIKPTDRGFHIITERPPPETMSFSYPKCFGRSDPVPDDLSKRLNEAARTAIMDSQRLFKNERFVPGILCPRGRGQVLWCLGILTLENSQVDHVDPKFRDIVASFIEDYGQPPPEALIKRPTQGWQFVNPSDATFFMRFHDEQALVRELVCTGCNMAAERGR